jgi:hypothetical protein
MSSFDTCILRAIRGTFDRDAGRELTGIAGTQRTEDYAQRGMSHVYYSYSRPLVGWLTIPDCQYAIEEGDGRVLYTSRPLTLEEIARWELAGGSAMEQGAIAVAWYRHTYGVSAAPTWYEVRGRGWLGVTFTPSTKAANGAWQSTTFDADGPSAHTWSDDLPLFVMRYIGGGDWRPMSPERVRRVWQSPQFLAGVDLIIAEHGVNR